MITHRAFYPNEMGSKKIKIDDKKVNGSWIEGVYFRHCKRVAAPINDFSKEDDYEHLIFFDGVGDWNLPTEIEKRVVIPDTVCRKFDYINIDGKTLYEKDMVEFKYIKDKIEYNGIGVIVYIDGKIYVKTIGKQFKIDQVKLVRIIGNIFEINDWESKLSLNINGFIGEIIGSVWDKSNGLTHYFVIKDNVGDTWKYGELNLLDNDCGKYISLLMRTFDTGSMNDSSFIGKKIYCVVQNERIVAIANDEDGSMKIMDLRNIFDNE